MSAIIVSPAKQPRESSRLLGPGGGAGPDQGGPVRNYAATSEASTSTETSGFNTPSDSTILLRSAPLKDSISRTRFVVVCAGIWSANFVFAFQSTAIPTLAPGIGSSFNHAELSSYLVSVFNLANAAGTSQLYTKLWCQGAWADHRRSDPGLWCPNGGAGAKVRHGHGMLLLWYRHGRLCPQPFHLHAHRRQSHRRGACNTAARLDYNTADQGRWAEAAC